MKYRDGFVSNSSSSSFILFLKKIPKTVKETEELLFKKNQEMYYGPWGDGEWPVEQVAKIVFDDIQRGILKPEQLIEKISNMDDPERPRYPGWQPSIVSGKDGIVTKIAEAMQWKKYNTEMAIYTAKKIDQLHDEHPGCIFVEVVYSDEGGDLSSAMEHGDLFHKVPHLKMSHH